MVKWNKFRTDFQSDEPPRSLFPLFWLHGSEEETEKVIRQEIQKMDEGGCGGFIIESRPHEDYLGERWWSDLEICLDEAEKRNMDVWIFDEEYYPSGIAGGKIVEQYPDYRMQVLVHEVLNWDKENLDQGMDHLIDDWDTVLKISCYPDDESGT